MGRWTDYYLDKDFEDFWRHRLGDNTVRVLTVLGVGFDPRCLLALRCMGGLGLYDRMGFIALKMIARPAVGEAGVITDRLAGANFLALDSIRGFCRQIVLDIEIQDEEGHNVAGRRALEQLNRVKPILHEYTDILVDISGMPRGLFFPLIAYLLRLAESGVFKNLHVAVVEEPRLDSRISGREYGQAEYLHTFRHQGDNKVVWLPLVGDNESARLEKIHNKIKGLCVEICPILPFPARSMRRVDDILVKHADLLFEGFLVSPDNILLCDERNPFDVYRKILDVEEYYRSRLGVIPAIGTVTTVVSPLSSKTLSLGMLLAAIERSLPVCYVEAGTYQVDVEAPPLAETDLNSGLAEIWVAGEPYTK